VRHGGERLHVVDRGGQAERAGLRRERRLDARVAALALEGVEHRGLLAADVRPGAAVHHDVDVATPLPKMFLPAAFVGVRLAQQRLVEHREDLGELAAHEDVDPRPRGSRTPR
jgi:hypothetical protein